MVAAFAAKGLNSRMVGWGSTFSESENDLSERGTTPSCPWNSLKAMSKLGPSSKIGPLPLRTCENRVEFCESPHKFNQFQLDSASSQVRGLIAD